MSASCEQWALWSRVALPDTVSHQSSGGRGPPRINTDYSYQARSMARVRGGMPLTNEGDDYADNFNIMRIASSAARFFLRGAVTEKPVLEDDRLAVFNFDDAPAR